MKLWQDMVRCASLGARALGPGAARAGEFLRSQIAEDGGLSNRAGRSDLYYTGLGLSAMAALGEAVLAPADRAKIEKYLQSFGDGAGLDIIHLSCLARSWACLRGPVPGQTVVPRACPLGEARAARPPDRSGEFARSPEDVGPWHPEARSCEDAGSWHRAIERWRSADGGFAQDPGAAQGTLYGCFLAVGAIQDSGAAVDRAEAVERCVLACRAADGGFSNAPGESLGLAPATAGAIQVIHALGKSVPGEWGRWLLDSCFRGGGFVAHEFSPEPDLLSTAVCLCAVALAGLALSGAQRQDCKAFVAGLQAGSGGFRGAASDALCDCEYTFYGLLAMGRLGDGTAG